MYREYRDTTLNCAIDRLCKFLLLYYCVNIMNYDLIYLFFVYADDDMAGRHRSRNKSIQIIKTATVAAKDCKRASTLQFHDSKIKFPLPHRVLRAPSKQLRSLYLAKRPHTHFA